MFEVVFHLFAVSFFFLFVHQTRMSDVSRSAVRTDIPLQMQIRPYGAGEAKDGLAFVS